MTINKLDFHPKQYLKMEEPLKFYVYDNITKLQFDTICDALTKRKIPLTITRKNRKNKAETTWSYQLQMPSFVLYLSEGGSEHCNIACRSFYPNQKEQTYRFGKLFLLEAAGGICLIYKKTVYQIKNGVCQVLSDEDEENYQWNMDPDAYYLLFGKMEDYFSEEDAYTRSEHVSGKMNDNVMSFFDQYTQKEHEYETRQVDFTQGIIYHDRVVGDISSGKKSNFILTSYDENAEPENCKLSVGQQVAIYGMDEHDTGLVGLLTDIDNESADGVRLVLEFYQQFDLSRLPETGYLFVRQNDTQKKIRTAVSRSIRSGRTPAKYMYKTFRDFSTEGYEPLERHEGLPAFLQKRMSDEYPPNEMQLEAIVKGVMTEDTLLVLGPPGTGKTTVILSWVEYFLSLGKRVLISSQNNSAVDNVLERLDSKSVEIVRLGRAEKVQSGCVQFLPENRVGTMRNNCQSNGQRLERQLTTEIQQIKDYVDGLLELDDKLNKYNYLQSKLDHLCKTIRMDVATIKECYSNIQDAKRALDYYRAESERYEIFCEESKRRNWLIRLFQAGLRRQAKKKIKDWAKGIQEKQATVDAKISKYNSAVDQLRQQLIELRKTNALQGIDDAYRELQKLNQRLFFGSAEKPALLPVFESELRTLPILDQRPFFSTVAIHNQQHVTQELKTMNRVLESAVKILEASRQWVNAALQDNRNDIFQEILLDSSQVVGATCIGINSNKLFANVAFDVTIIDESGQIQLHNALVPMSRSPKTLMLGDYKQIPPIVNDEIVEACRMENIQTELFKQSFFEFLFEKMRQRQIDWLVNNPHILLPADQNSPEEQESIPREQLEELARASLLKPVAQGYIGKSLETGKKDEQGKPIFQSRYTQKQIEEFVTKITEDKKKIVNLNSQFRMPGNVSDVISEWFYESNYFSSYNMEKFQPVVPNTTKPMVVISTSGMDNRFESQPESKMGYQNVAEAKLVADVMEAVLAGLDEKELLKYRSELGKRLGIISAYGAQVRYIRQALKSRLGFTNEEANQAVASLDSFQGQERDLIIYSLTRSGRKPEKAARVGFLKELRRLNVAFTRCKKQLVIIGDLNYLQDCAYVESTADPEKLPCVNTADDWIGKPQINQCAECKLDCERRFARFFRLLMQHVQADPPSGDLLKGETLKEFLKGDGGNAG